MNDEVLERIGTSLSSILLALDEIDRDEEGLDLFVLGDLIGGVERAYDAVGIMQERNPDEDE